MSSNQQHIAQFALVQKFKNFYADSHDLPVDDIGQIYHTDIVFKDPITEIRGLPGIHGYLSNMCASVSECRFEYLDEIITDERAYIKWNMHYRHPKLGNKLVMVRGISHIEFSNLITYHEDVYDMGQMVYEHIPILGRCIRWLKVRLEPSA